MKIGILYNFRSGPWGGGNQFLKALKKELDRSGHLTSELSSADMLIVNSYSPGNERVLWQAVKQVIFYRRKLICRVDGPISLIRGSNLTIDNIIALFCKYFCDGIIFQSHWSKQQNKELTNISLVNEAVIYNASDDDIFNRSKPVRKFIPEQVKLVAASWSDNERKGFRLYEYLDNHLDWSRYQLTFIGHSPIKFKNIKVLAPLGSVELAKELKQNDIFITASRHDPCSNMLIEALSCGLPALAINDGGHPEILQKGGELFNSEADVLDKIDLVANRYSFYRAQLPIFGIKEVAEQYYSFCQVVANSIAIAGDGGRPVGRYWRWFMAILLLMGLIFKLRMEYLWSSFWKKIKV